KEAEHEYQSIGGPTGVADSVPSRCRLNSSSLHMPTGGVVNGDITLPPVDYCLMECSSPLPSPPPAAIFPSLQTTPLTPPSPPSSHPGPSISALSCPLPPVPLPGPLQTPPPLGPPPPPIPRVPSHLMGTRKGRSQESQPITDRHSDLQSTITHG
ncbi:wiskott-Aldrich syndrome protein family member 3, partial [Clarias magur]